MHRVSHYSTSRSRLLAVTGLTVLALRAPGRYTYATVGWLWYLGMLVPVIGLIQVGSQPMADRYTYLPLIGLFIAHRMGTPRLAATCTGEATYAHGGCNGRNGGEHGSRAPAGCRLGKQRRPLGAHAASDTRQLPRAQQSRPCVLAAGKSPVAFPHYEAGAAHQSRLGGAHTGIGAILVPAGRLDEAIAHYRQALRVNPTDAITLANLGGALAEQGQVAEAETHLRAAVAAAPGFAASSELPRRHARQTGQDV